jgi:hypothetical protein
MNRESIGPENDLAVAICLAWAGGMAFCQKALDIAPGPAAAPPILLDWASRWKSEAGSELVASLAKGCVVDAARCVVDCGWPPWVETEDQALEHFGDRLIIVVRQWLRDRGLRPDLLETARRMGPAWAWYLGRVSAPA